MTAIILLARLLSSCAAVWPLRPVGAHRGVRALLVARLLSPYAALWPRRPAGAHRAPGRSCLSASCHHARPCGLFAPSGLIGAAGPSMRAHKLHFVERAPAMRGFRRVASARARPTALKVASAMW